MMHSCKVYTVSFSLVLVGLVIQVYFLLVVRMVEVVLCDSGEWLVGQVYSGSSCSIYFWVVGN